MLPLFRTLILASLVLALPGYAESDEQQDFNTLYRVTLLRAAPGEHVNLNQALRERTAKRPAHHLIQHSQGAHWDFMTIEALGSYADWFGEGQPNRQLHDQMWREHLDRKVVFREEWFAYGPAAETISDGMANNKLLHIEMFRALAGHKTPLLTQRFAENEYLHLTGQITNLVFKGDMGADWDAMTIGFHADMKSFAHGSDLSLQQKNAIAQQVGFASVADIAPYLRSLIDSHQDTLAVPIVPPKPED